MSEASFLPRKMQWLEQHKQFCIEWKDGHASQFTLSFLRENCPCALCKEEIKNPFRMLKQESIRSMEARTFEPQGHYAIKISWEDGHSTGIYPYEYLRKLCPCSICKGSHGE